MILTPLGGVEIGPYRLMNTSNAPKRIDFVVFIGRENSKVTKQNTNLYKQCKVANK